MKAQLFVKGMREPVELEPQEAKAAQLLIDDASRPDDTTFSVEGVWSGHKADMKFVVFPKVEQVSGMRFVEPMTKAEAEVFEAEIEQDKVKAAEIFGNNKDGEPRRYKWQGLYLARKGAIKMEVIDVDGRKIEKVLSRDSILWGKLEEKIRSYTEFLIKRDLAIDHENKELAKMAEEAIPHE